MTEMKLSSPPQEPQNRFSRFVNRFGEPHKYRLLAYHAALPRVLTPELVHYLRIEFLGKENVPWEAEVDLLLSDLCSQVGHEVYAMDTEIRKYLLEQMEADPFFGEVKMRQVDQALTRYQQADGWEIKRQEQTNTQYQELLRDDLAIQMLTIPGGTFLMGSPEDELYRRESEGPQHQVWVSGFYMAAYPTTQAQWSFVAGLPQVNRELKPDPSRFKGQDRPVEQVTWFDAVEFCDRLSNYTGRVYRLPTEAEWEYACRASTKTPFYFGETISPKLANYYCSDSYNGGPKGDRQTQTTPVGHYGVANAFGLADMHGNVWEWCQDDWHEDYRSAPVDGSACLKPGFNDKVSRGGSWEFCPDDCRSASRCRTDPDDSYNSIGFRVVCTSRSFGGGTCKTK